MVLSEIFKQLNMKKYQVKLVSVGKRLAMEFPKKLCEDLDLKIGSKLVYSTSPDNNFFTLKKIND